jgi:hypothetical protein
MPAARKKNLTSPPPMESMIHVVRGHKVMIDSDLAKLYGVATKALNQAVRRHVKRFPQDFMFQLTAGEVENLRSQIVTSSSSYGGRRYLPYVFTEHGVVMLSSVLNSERATQMNIAIVRAFVRLRELISAHQDLASRIEKLERGHVKTGDVIEILVEDIDRLARDIRWIKNPPLPPKHRMGFFFEKDDQK